MGERDKGAGDIDAPDEKARLGNGLGDEVALAEREATTDGRARRGRDERVEGVDICAKRRQG